MVPRVVWGSSLMPTNLFDMRKIEAYANSFDAQVGGGVP